MFPTLPPTVTVPGLIWGALKLLYIAGALIYVGFAIIVVTQVSRMTATVKGPIDAFLKLLVWIHLAIAILTLLMAIVIL